VEPTLLEGRHALVTGGGRGIGRAIAAALTRSGASVTILGRTEDALKDTVAKGQAQGYYVVDVVNQSAVQACIGKASAIRGSIDILVANAGGAETATFLNAEPDQFRRMFEVNLLGVVHASRAVLDDMLRQGFGRIIAVASTAGLKGYPYVTAYCAAKHAVVGLIRALALETVAKGVTVNAVCPGFTDTEMIEESLKTIARKTGRSPQEARAAMLKTSPLGRLIKPEEVAAAVVFLSSPAAAAITGTTIAVAGGEL
jgi:3-hydroxybutyrate dehydrogenase